MPCPECNQGWNGWWCKPCNSKHFQNDFNNWTSGNDKIGKFIQDEDAQLNANYPNYVIEWILYDRFKEFKQIGKGGFGTVHYANSSIRFYGITQDPETHSYVMVLGYAEDGNLREYLKINFNNINWQQKLSNLRKLSINLNNIHKLDIVHQDFHPGNILSLDFKRFMFISDFGSKVLSGDEEYTKAADIYSFGIIAYEIVTGFPPYPDIPHDEDLAMKICNGLRPKIPFHTPKLITRIIMRCWDARVTNRPTFKELQDELRKYRNDYLKEGKNKDSEIVIQIKKAEEFSANQESTNTTTTTTPLNYQTHPQAIYTSRLLNYSKLPKPKNEENFERELEELTKSFYKINDNDDIDEF
ncbi:hypothetical protein Glove_557g4 [Diversispora epigaea]|uniref:Protein kinase domain-containing protein n=1 Tax=Diversispora epigaea TaxID=1348612 RepID=A0A397GCK6_9GLOM|nr:hypothetical protein Glove_557g4 [Diversispora epigaea]